MRHRPTSRRLACAGLMLLTPVVVFGGAARNQPTEVESPVTPRRVAAQVNAKLPRMIVEEPAGERGPRRFVAPGRGVTTVLTAQGPSWLVTGKAGRVRVDLRPVDAATVEPVGRERGGGHVSRFRGRPDQWETGLPIWRSVEYTQLWQDIDLLVESKVSCIKSTFVVAPGGDTDRIRLALLGAETARIDDAGRLEVETAAGDVVDQAPVAWLADGSPVGVKYALTRDGENVTIGFAVEAHDRTQTLLLDPAVISQSGFLGGAGSDNVSDLKLDGAGNIYLAGWTDSLPDTFPAVVGPDLTPEGDTGPFGDAFVAKINAAGTAVLYAGYIGGWESDFANGLAVDSLGRVYVCGHTDCDNTTENFPTTNGPDTSFGGSVDGWVARVAADGLSLEYCGYIGGSGHEDRAFDVDVDSLGRAYVVGRTNSSDASFPATVGPDTTKGTSSAGFVSRIKADGTGFEYLGYIDGDQFEDVNAVVAGPLGEAWVCGYTQSDEASFPVAVGPSLVKSGNQDGFVAKILADGTDLAWCGYIGGQGSENVADLDVDGQGNVFVVGTTNDGADFPALVGPDLTFNGGISDGFVAKVVPSGQSLAWCGFIGGSEWNGVGSIGVDRLGGVWITGFEHSTESAAVPPVLVNGPDLTHNGKQDAYVCRVQPSGASLDFAGYFGGSERDGFLGLAFLPEEPGEPDRVVAWTACNTESDELTIPVSVGPDLTYNGGDDSMIVKITATVMPEEPPPDSDPTITFVAKKGTAKDSSKAGKDRFFYKGTLAFEPESPDGVFDHGNDVLTLTCGSAESPYVVVIPANDPGWKLKPGKSMRWKTKGALVKLNLKSNVLIVKLAKFDYPAEQALPLGFALEFGDDNGADDSDWITKKKPGTFKLTR